MIELRDVAYRAGSRFILDRTNVNFPPGRFTVVMGPNGAGKSTLLRIAAGLARPTHGTVAYDGRDIATIPVASLARTRAVLSQHVTLPFTLRAEDVVMMGRYPHFARVPTARDRGIVAEALSLVGMETQGDQLYPTLSGGEQQKVQLARVLAQIWPDPLAARPTYLFLDEPTSDLDVRYQLHILDIARRLLADACTVVAVLHDINTALTYGDNFIILDRGSVALATQQATAVDADVLERVFGVRAERVGGIMWRFASLKPAPTLPSH